MAGGRQPPGVEVFDTKRQWGLEESQLYRSAEKPQMARRLCL